MTVQLANSLVECTIPNTALLLPPGKLVDPANPDWCTLAWSWDNLPHDMWMADGGTYRRRRYAAFHVSGDQCKCLSHRPHFQERDHNPLNGGVERWFAPMAEVQTELPLFQKLIFDTASLIACMSERSPQAWMVEAHQFRIEALMGQAGLPTPEGMHHDGREWVLILLIGGSNYAGGESHVESVSGASLIEHRLSHPGEALLLNDRNVRHGTSPIEAVIPYTPAWRDTLVLTFAQAQRN
ncbi:hypothetical protein D6851_03030 [Altericroceibacterium spongiae]|uniref:2OG-Fe dioxygenase family protein n=1 Tax=Altericroceibacterium spongiae TaxID=2320269 RepID=A0A420ERV5_9SPHN|nr:2OG-Fe dioxygenase family protein [Altericroceibacterium spongiae]RKF23454.1 hypothetical protein D6851_03030 [Altericroceibacterium spongiae]